MNNANSIRKNADLAKLKELQSKMPKVLEIIKIKGDPPYSITCKVKIPTPRNNQFPITRQELSEFEIQLPEKFPFQQPIVTFKTPIWNPNIYDSGKWCFGDWKITENMELFIIRLMKVIALDPQIINPASPANSQAARWYVKNLTTSPNLFPTISLKDFMIDFNKPKISWRNIR